MNSLVPTSRGEVANIAGSRSAIQTRFQTIVDLIVKTSNEIEEIKNRGFFDRVFRNNIRDLAVAMQNVVQIQQQTLAFVTALIELHAKNVRMLEFLRTQVYETREQLLQLISDSRNTSLTLTTFTDTLASLVDVVDTKIKQARTEGAKNAAGGKRLAIAVVVGLVLAAVVLALVSR